jgi:DNA-directed RNA polymerase specialized sigma24 family protein
MQSPDTSPEPITSWTQLWKAHHGAAEEKAQARAALVERYQGFVRAVLGRAFRRHPRAAELVDECEQECWTRLLEGRFQPVVDHKQEGDDSRPAFRPYLQKVLSNLVSDHWRRIARAPVGLGEFDPEAPEPVSEAESRSLYAQQLLGSLLGEMASQDARTGREFSRVLLAKRDHPDASLEELARRLSTPGQTRSQRWVGTTLHRARNRLCELLRQRIAEELQPPADREAAAPGRVPTEADVDEELAALGLLKFCQSRTRADAR